MVGRRSGALDQLLSRTTAARLALVAYLGVPLALVLGPLPAAPYDAVLGLVRWASHGPDTVERRALVEMAGNVVLLVPVGGLLVLSSGGLRVGAATLTCFALSATIELTQLVALPGRHASLLDVLLNTVGGGLGATSSHAIGLWWCRRSR